MSTTVPTEVSRSRSAALTRLRGRRPRPRSEERLPHAAGAPAAVETGAAASSGISFWFEAIVLVWLLVAYDAINNLAPVSRAAALTRASSILAFERSLHVDIELALNRWLAGHSILGYVAASYYDLGHFLITFGVFGVLLWRRRDLYPQLRTQLVLINLIAFVVFWRYPVAPPRMLVGAGFSDIVARTDALVDFHSGSLAHDANQYAALPSLHVAWAMWSARAIWRIVRRPIVRVAAVLMPLFTAFTVLATGNHFVLDVVAGAATFGLGWLLTEPLHRLAGRMHRRIARAGAASGLPARVRIPAVAGAHPGRAVGTAAVRLRASLVGLPHRRQRALTDIPDPRQSLGGEQVQCGSQ